MITVVSPMFKNL